MDRPHEEELGGLRALFSFVLVLSSDYFLNSGDVSGFSSPGGPSGGPHGGSMAAWQHQLGSLG